MLTNNKQKTEKKKNKITKLPMKYLTNWFIDT